MASKRRNMFHKNKTQETTEKVLSGEGTGSEDRFDSQIQLGAATNIYNAIPIAKSSIYYWIRLKVICGLAAPKAVKFINNVEGKYVVPLLKSYSAIIPHASSQHNVICSFDT
ncbi:hypothetical protein AAG570_001426 [Ranatra chinensis]|uniref:Uncharacterized protein n=1 Tax=Ranatra chinensis TaxID=642074 RepID=A0ABD0YBV2_9HEMI